MMFSAEISPVAMLKALLRDCDGCGAKALALDARAARRAICLKFILVLLLVSEFDRILAFARL